jgi:hypothetical protein
MKYLKHIYEMDGNDIPWASPYRLGLGVHRFVTKDNLPKPGDKVRCLLTLPPGIASAAGYIPGRIITVHRISQIENRPIIWPTEGGNGIYFDMLEYID